MTPADARHDLANAGLVLNETRKKIKKGRTVTEQDADRLAGALKDATDTIEKFIKEHCS